MNFCIFQNPNLVTKLAILSILSPLSSIYHTFTIFLILSPPFLYPCTFFRKLTLDDVSSFCLTHQMTTQATFVICITHVPALKPSPPIWPQGMKGGGREVIGDLKKEVPVWKILGEGWSTLSLCSKLGTFSKKVALWVSI